MILHFSIAVWNLFVVAVTIIIIINNLQLPRHLHQVQSRDFWIRLGSEHQLHQCDHDGAAVVAHLDRAAANESTRWDLHGMRHAVQSY